MRKIIAITVSLALLLSNAQMSFAVKANGDGSTGNVTIGEIDENDIPSSDIVFQDTDSAGGIKPRIAMTYLVCQALSTSTDRQTFVKYLTGSWAYASQYVWSQSNTTSWGVDSSCTAEVKEAIKAQITVRYIYTATYGVAVTVPANVSRLSKLGFYSDFTKKYVKTEVRFPTGNPPLGYRVDATYYNYSYEPTPDTYLLVTYQ